MNTLGGAAVKRLFDDGAWDANLARTTTGQVSECWQNVCMILQHHAAWKGVVAFDKFATRPVKRKPTPTQASAGEWTPDDTYQLGLWLSQQLQFTVKSIGTLVEGVNACANSNAFNPVIEWLETLAWDGVPRLEFWMHECLGAKEGAYSSAVGRYFLLNMVARVMEPGCIMRSVPVLEGAQNKGKSTALRILAEPWFSDSHLDIGNKDAYEMIQGSWIYEIAEMHAFSKAEASKVKQFISSREDTWVPKWVRGRIKVPRQMVFAGSVNPDGAGYLRDWTGNTRFWPVLCEEEGSLDLDRLREWRPQLFAEALTLYRSEARRYPTDEEDRLLFSPAQEERLNEHPWVDPIAAWLDDPLGAGSADGPITAHMVLTKAVRMEVGKQTVPMLQDVGRIMAKLGWLRKRQASGSRAWFYESPSAQKGRLAEAGVGGSEGSNGPDDAPI